jgi:hypothetical protein
MFWNGWNHVEDNTQEVFMGGMGLWKHYSCVVNKSAYNALVIIENTHNSF